MDTIIQQFCRTPEPERARGGSTSDCLQALRDPLAGMKGISQH